MLEYDETEEGREILRKLMELKSRIPKVDCRGWCFRSCTGIDVTPVEHAAIKARHGIHIPMLPPEAVRPNATPGFHKLALKARRTGKLCPALDENRRCRIWNDKEVYPSICSAWGAVEHLKCPFVGYGCEPPADGYMTFVEYRLLVAEIEDLAGSFVSTAMDRVKLRQVLSTGTGRRRAEEKVRQRSAPDVEYWREYIETNPDNLPLEKRHV